MMNVKNMALTKPTAPTGLSAVSGVGKVSLIWNLVSSATVYNVLRSTVSGGGYTKIATVIDESYEDVMSNPMDETTYYYVVTASNDGGESDYSVEVASNPKPLYTDKHIYIHPSRWSGGSLPSSVRDELVLNHGTSERVEVLTEHPFVIVRAYN